MVIQHLIGNPYNGYINPYYWVDDHPLLYGNNGSLDPSTHVQVHILHQHDTRCQTAVTCIFPRAHLAIHRTQFFVTSHLTFQVCRTWLSTCQSSCWFCKRGGRFGHTNEWIHPRKIDGMEPENGWFPSSESPLPKVFFRFQVSEVNFRGFHLKSEESDRSVWFKSADWETKRCLKPFPFVDSIWLHLKLDTSMQAWRTMFTRSKQQGATLQCLSTCFDNVYVHWLASS